MMSFKEHEKIAKCDRRESRKRKILNYEKVQHSFIDRIVEKKTRRIHGCLKMLINYLQLRYDF